MPFLRAALIKRKTQPESEPEKLPAIEAANVVEEDIREPEYISAPEKVSADAEDIHAAENAADSDNVPEIQEEEESEPEHEGEPETAEDPELTQETEQTEEPETVSEPEPEPEEEQPTESEEEPAPIEPEMPESVDEQEDSQQEDEPEIEIVEEPEEPETSEEGSQPESEEPPTSEPEPEPEVIPDPEPEPEQPKQNKDYSGATLNYDFTSGERYVDTVSTKTEFDKMLDELAAISGDLLSHEVEKFAVKFTGKFQGDNDKAEADAKKYEAFLGGYITNAAMLLYDNGYRDAAIKRLDQAKSILEARKKLEDETEAIKTRVEEQDDSVDLSDILGLLGD